MLAWVVPESLLLLLTCKTTQHDSIFYTFYWYLSQEHICLGDTGTCVFNCICNLDFSASISVAWLWILISFLFISCCRADTGRSNHPRRCCSLTKPSNWSHTVTIDALNGNVVETTHIGSTYQTVFADLIKVASTSINFRFSLHLKVTGSVTTGSEGVGWWDSVEHYTTKWEHVQFSSACIVTSC